MAQGSDTPLASSTAIEPPAAAPAPTAASPPPRRGGGFRLSTFILVFLGLLGLWMVIDTSFRNSLAGAMGTGSSTPGFLYAAIGFNSQYLLLTMAIAGAVEMAITAIAYNFVTDWVKAAKVQKWSSAFRKVQMAAMRSGKKDRIDSLKPYQQKLTRMSSEVSIAQLKGMAVTWFLLILIYTWVGLVIVNAPNSYVNLGGSTIGLLNPVVGPIPYWFLIFSLYTVPLSFIFRRLLKDVWLARYERTHHVPPLPTPAS
ncbi:MAG: EMC3/TMCO1 family protein [Thermoplasmata archaeon]